jgi:glycosyltransferase involved in cell wall biosynthesis
MKSKPLFSICIPVRNDLKNIRQCLAGLKNQDLRDCEVLVCDDGSTPPVASSDLRENAVEFELITQEGQGPSAARNHLSRRARGEYLFFIDADTVPRFDMLEQARAIVTDQPDIDVFYGSYDDEPAHETLISTYRNLLHHYTHHESANRNEKVRTFWCGCGVIRREVYLQFGGLSEFYDKPSIEDIELGTRLAACGYGVQIFPELQVKHLKKWTLKSWLHTDLFRRGIPWVRLMRATRDWTSQLNFSWVQRLASMAAVIFVACLPLTAIHPAFGALSLIALLGFVFANIRFLNLVRKKRGLIVSLGVVPLHLIYALICVASVGAAFLYSPLRLPPTPRLTPLHFAPNPEPERNVENFK